MTSLYYNRKQSTSINISTF